MTGSHFQIRTKAGAPQRPPSLAQPGTATIAVTEGDSWALSEDSGFPAGARPAFARTQRVLSRLQLDQGETSLREKLQLKSARSRVVTLHKHLVPPLPQAVFSGVFLEFFVFRIATQGGPVLVPSWCSRWAPARVPASWT